MCGAARAPVVAGAHDAGMATADCGRHSDDRGAHACGRAVAQSSLRPPPRVPSPVCRSTCRRGSPSSSPSMARRSRSLPMEAVSPSSVCAQGVPSLFIHTLDTGKTDEVPDTRDAATPMFSADSQWVAFGQDGIDQEGSGRRRPGANGRTWRRRPDDLAFRRPLRARQREWLAYPSDLPDDRALTQVTEGEEGHLTPLLMRNGSLLFTSAAGRHPEQLEQHQRLAARARLRRARSCRTRRVRNSLGTRCNRLCARPRAVRRGVRQPRHSPDQRAARHGHPGADNASCRPRRCTPSPTMARSFTRHHPVAAVSSGSIATAVRNS